MNLYLVKRPDGADYDEYDSFVVAANTEYEARGIHPRGGPVDKNSGWPVLPNLDLLQVECVGSAAPHLTNGQVVCASFNAG